MVSLVVVLAMVMVMMGAKVNGTEYPKSKSGRDKFNGISPLGTRLGGVISGWSASYRLAGLGAP